MLATGHGGLATLAYEEPLAGSVPEIGHLEEIAACHWVGFRLLPPPELAIENLLVGKTRLPQFKDAKRSELTRILRLHFRARRVDFHGESLRLADWVEKWRHDEVLRRTVRAHPAFARWVEALTARFRDEPLVALAMEGSRSCYGRLGGDPGTLRAMHGYMDAGGI